MTKAQKIVIISGATGAILMVAGLARRLFEGPEIIDTLFKIGVITLMTALVAGMTGLIISMLKGK